ncbi:MAG: hypothetical protein ACI4TR_03900 [Bacteroidaceae bacterium]
MEKHFDSVIYNQLSAIANSAEWDAMSDYLNRLNNSAFRTASYVLAERVLPELDNDNFWKCFSAIVPGDAKVYLVTFLKAAKKKYEAGELNFLATDFMAFAESVRQRDAQIDRQKSLLMILPLLRTVKEVENVLNAFCGSSHELKIKYLILAQESIPGYYVLFQEFRRGDFSSTQIERFLIRVLGRATRYAFNFVVITKEYFGLPNNGRLFSLVIQSYEISRLEKSFEDFKKILTRI